MIEIDIRPLDMRDAAAVFEAVRESRAEVSRWMDWCRPDYSPADAEAWIHAAMRGREDGSHFQFGIFDTGRHFLGACGLSSIDEQARFANLGYWVRTRAAGQGIATQAARLVIDWAFKHTDLQRIEIVAAVGNRGSQRVAEKVGGIREGVLRSRLTVFGEFHDAVMFSVVRGDPRPRSASSLRRRILPMAFGGR